MFTWRSANVVAAATITLIVLWFGWSSRKSPSFSIPSSLSIHHTSEEQRLIEELGRYGVQGIKPGTSVQYAKLDLTAESSSNCRSSVLQHLDLSFPQLHEVRSSKTGTPSDGQAVVHIPPTLQPRDVSNIVFGVATNLDRLRDSLIGFAHWASNNGARIIASVQAGPSPRDIEKVSREANKLGLELLIIPDERDFQSRYFSLTKLLYDHRDRAEWAALIDDDTFFPSISAVQDLLAKYDSAQPHYIGSLSEDFFQVLLWGLIAYGGAGIFTSMPLLHQLSPHVDTCLQDHSTGDRRTAACIYNHTLTRMTYEPSLHQVDLKGDATGFYEALRPTPISIHHWKSWNRINVPAAALVSRVCGDTCIFQKYQLADGWRLTNGVSLTKYSSLPPQSSNPNSPSSPNDKSSSSSEGEVDITMEKTWNPSRGDDQEEMFRHSLAPLRPKDQHKIQYLLEAAVIKGSDSETSVTVRQFYVRRFSDVGVKGRQDRDQSKGGSVPEAQERMEVIEIAWRKGPGSVMGMGRGVVRDAG